MKYTTFPLVFLFPLHVCAQVFMRPFDHAVSMALGGATLAYPDAFTGAGNEAFAGFAPRAAVGASSALPYGLTDWQAARMHGLFRIDGRSGGGFEFIHSGVDAYNEQRFRTVYGRKLAQNWSLGASLDLLHISAVEYGSATGFTFGVGFLARVMPTVWLASRVQNPLQQKMAGVPLPTLLVLGCAWRPGEVFTLLAEVEKELERTAQVKCGLEYRPVEKMVFRAGIRSLPARFSFGAGIRLNHGISIDVATEWHQVLGLTPSVMVGWGKK